jgi:hypothetical protein
MDTQVRRLPEEDNPQTENNHKPIRKVRRDKGRILLTERDIVTLRWIGEQYAIRFDQLQRLLGRQAQRETLVEGFLSKDTTDRIVKRWEALGYVGRAGVLHREPEWVWLTRKGLREIGFKGEIATYRDWQPKPATVRHIYYMNQARLYIEKRDPQRVWKSERSLRADRGRRALPVDGGHYVDAEVLVDGRVIGVEIELTPKVPERLIAIMTELARAYKLVWYFTLPESKSVVEKSLQALPESDRRRFGVYDLEAE